MEENDTVSRALARLAEVEEKVEALHEEQVGKGSSVSGVYVNVYVHVQFNSDFFVFGETVKDYVALIVSIKVGRLLECHAKVVDSPPPSSHPLAPSLALGNISNANQGIRQLAECADYLGKEARK